MLDARRSARSFLITIVVFLLLPGLALAQGRLRGTTKHVDGKPVPGVEIRMVSQTPGIPDVTTTSNKKGKFVFGLLRNATYRLVAFADGMRITHIDANLAEPDDDSKWAVDEPVSQGSELPTFAITGVSVVTYDLVFEPHDGDPGEYGTGLPVSPVTVVVGLIGEGKLAEADAEIVRALKRAPESATLHYLEGFLRLNQGRFDEGLEAANRALEADPTMEGARLLKGRILKEQGDKEAALALFDAEASSAAAVDVRRDALLEKAIVCESLGRKEEAITALEQLIEVAPDMVEAYKELAGLYLQVGNQAKANALMEQVRSLGAADPNILFNLGADRFNEDDFEAAADYFTQVVELQPDFADAWLRLGFTRLNLGDQPGAAEALRKFVELSPEDDPNVPTATAILNSIAPE